MSKSSFHELKQSIIVFNPMINLILVEDNRIVRDALVKFFKNEEGFRLAGVASDAATAIEQLQVDPTIDIMMADWNMPDMDGLELTTIVASEFPKTKVIILTMHGKQDYKEKAKAAGAKGYILKDQDFDDLVSAVKDVAEGRVVFN